MSTSTFTPGDQEHTTETITDIDGEIYPGETIKLKKSMYLYGPNPEEEGQTPEETAIHLYTVYPGERAVELEISSGFRLLIVDPMGQDVWVDAVREQLHGLGEWLISEARKLHGDPQEG